MGFAFSKALTLAAAQAGSADSANWPLAICLDGNVQAADANLKTVANGGHVQSSSGYDIRPYADSAFTTPLDFELKFYDGTAGKIEMWVRIPTLSHTTNVVIYLAYGDASITTDGSVNTTWNSAFLGVYHLGDGTTLGLADSTSNGYNLTNTGSIAAAAGELNGGTATLNGTSQYLSNASLPQNAGATVSVSFWLNQTTANLTGGSGFTLGNAGTDRAQAHAPYSDKTLYFDMGNDSSGRVTADYTSYLDVWTLVHLVFNSADNTHKIFLNGAQVSSTTNATTNSTNLTGLWIGAWPAQSLYAKSKFDEFRVSNVAPSASWTLADYNSQKASSTFIAWGSEVASGPVAITTPQVFPPWLKSGVGPNPARVGRMFAFLGAQSRPPQTASVDEGSATAVDTPSAVLAPQAIAESGVVVRNQFTYTEQLDNAAWIKTNVTITPDAIADSTGAVTADKMVEASAGAGDVIQRVSQNVASVPSSTTVNVLFEVKAAGRTWARIRVVDNNGALSSAWFDIGSVAVGSKDAAYSASSITSLGNGWYRCIGAIDSASGTGTFSAGIAIATGDTNTSYVGDGVSGLYVTRAQLDIGAATAYQAIPLVDRDTVSATTSAASSVVSEGSNTSADSSSASNSTNAAVAESGAAADTPSASNSTNSVVAESGATADTISATRDQSATVAEGSNTASDTPSATKAQAASQDEGSPTAADSSSATKTLAAAQDEGSPTAVDTPSAVQVRAANIAEGSPTAADSQDGVLGSGTNVVEGGNTSADTPSATLDTQAATAESVTPVDTTSATQLLAALLAESGSGVDTPSATRTQAAAMAEGFNSAADTQDASIVAGVQAIGEGSPTAVDTTSATTSRTAVVSEGDRPLIDTVSATGGTDVVPVGPTGDVGGDGGWRPALGPPPILPRQEKPKAKPYVPQPEPMLLVCSARTQQNVVLETRAVARGGILPRSAQVVGTVTRAAAHEVSLRAFAKTSTAVSSATASSLDVSFAANCNSGTLLKGQTAGCVHDSELDEFVDLLKMVYAVDDQLERMAA